MKFPVKSLLLLFVLTVHLNSFGQSINTDSLKMELEKDHHDSIRVKILNKLSIAYRLSAPSESELYARKALSLIRDTTSLTWAATADNVGTPLAIGGKYEESIRFFLASLKIKEKLGDSTGIANSYNNLGNVYKLLGEKPALEYFEKAYKIYERLNDKRGMGLSLNNMGSMYGIEHNYEKALDAHRRSLQIKKGMRDTVGMIYSYNNFTVIYEKMGRPDSALFYAKETYDLALKDKNYDVIISNLATQGKLYATMKDYKQSIEKLQESERLSVEKGYSQRLRMSYVYLSETYEKMGEIAKAFDYYKKAENLEDSTLAIAHQKNIAELNTKYESEKKEQQLHLQHVEIKKDKMLRNFLIGLSVMILLLAFWRARIKQKQNKRLEEKNLIIEQKNKDITDSIRYAKRIQQAILPPADDIQASLKDHFILYKPKDIVSGDFYWLSRNDDHVLFAVVDCTGHGVPGAFMSIVANNALNEAVHNSHLTDPAAILDKANELMHLVLKQNSGDGTVRDGMDIALCKLPASNESFASFAGANNSLVLVRDGNVIEYKADRQPVGFYHGETKAFTPHQVEVKRNDMLYLFTDGFADQFGGENGKKVGLKKFKNILASLSTEPTHVQKEKLELFLSKWKSDLEQIDDVCVAGIRV